MSIPNNAKQMIFHNLGGSEMWRTFCSCEPQNCPYLQFVNTNTGYQWHYKETGRYTDVYFRYFVYPSGDRAKLPNAKDFCARCMFNNAR